MSRVAVRTPPSPGCPTPTVAEAEARHRRPPRRRPRRLLPRRRLLARQRRRGRVPRRALPQGSRGAPPRGGDDQPAGRPDPDRRRRELRPAGARRRPAVQRRRRPRRQHRRDGAGPGAGQRAAPRRLRPAADHRHLEGPLRLVAGRQARPDHRLRPHRRGHRRPAGRLRGRPRSPGSPAGPATASPRCAPIDDLHDVLPARRGRLRHRPAHPADRGPDRRGRAGPAARRRAAGQRRPRQARRHRRAASAETASGRIRAALDVTDPSRCRRTTRCGRSRACSIAPHVGGASSAFWPRVGPADRRPAAPLRRGRAAGERHHRPAAPA